MKQHMLTHKIRDMPAHLFENKKSPTFTGQQQTPPSNQSEDISEVSNLSNSNSMATEDSKMGSMNNINNAEVPVVNPEPETPAPIKRLPIETELPVPKRQPSKKK